MASAKKLATAATTPAAAPPKPAGDKAVVVAHTPIRHDGHDHAEGEAFECSADTAAALVAAGAAEAA